MELPVTPKRYDRTMRSRGEPVLVLSIQRPSFPDRGRTGRMERYFSQLAQQWQERWETALYPKACQALERAKEQGLPFLPWQMKFEYTVTLWQPPVISIRVDVTEQGPTPLPCTLCIGQVWDCAAGYPRTLRSFLPAKPRRWRKRLLEQLGEQARLQLESGLSLLDDNCIQTMAQAFDPERFFLTEQGLAVYYPQYLLGPYAEGIPVFTIPVSG